MITKVGMYRDKRNKDHPWVVRWFGEYDPLKYKQKQYSKGFPTKHAAEEFRTSKQMELNKEGIRNEPKEILLDEFVKSFWATKNKTYRIETKKVYSNTFQQLEVFFGPDFPIRQITPELADRFIATRKRVAPQGKGYSNASRNRHLRSCKAAFKLGVQWGYIQQNPFAHIKTDKITLKRWHYLRPAEFQKILNAVDNLRWKVFYLLAYTTGGRLGELFNLTWSDIDFEKGSITIRNRPSTAQMPPFFVKDHEDRVLFIPQQALSTLVAWQMIAPESVPYILLTEQRWIIVKKKWDLCRAGKPWKWNPKTQALEWGEWENRSLVNNVLRDMRVHVRKTAIALTAPLTIHTLRKSFAQNHADNGTPSHTLKTLMGHASITTTEKFYLQQSDDNTKAAVKRYEKLLNDQTAVKMLYKPQNTILDTTNPSSENPVTQPKQ
jgi:integrase